MYYIIETLSKNISKYFQNNATLYTQNTLKNCIHTFVKRSKLLQKNKKQKTKN